MKTLAIAMLLIFFAGCDFVLGVMDKVQLPQVEFPILKQLGLTWSGHRFVITNGTPLFAVVLVYGTRVAQLGPGESATGAGTWQLNAQIPLAVLFHRDSQLNSYVGTAMKIFSVTSEQPTVNTWSVVTGEIQTPDARNASAAWAVSPPATTQMVKIADFPKEWRNATAALQIVNNSVYSMTVLINGEPRASNLDPGDFYYFAARRLADSSYSTPMAIHLTFTDQGRFVGTYDSSISVPGQGVVAYQLAVNTAAIRR